MASATSFAGVAFANFACFAVAVSGALECFASTGYTAFASCTIVVGVASDFAGAIFADFAGLALAVALTGGLFGSAFVIDTCLAGLAVGIASATCGTAFSCAGADLAGFAVCVSFADAFFADTRDTEFAGAAVVVGVAPFATLVIPTNQAFVTVCVSFAAFFASTRETEFSTGAIFVHFASCGGWWLGGAAAIGDTNRTRTTTCRVHTCTVGVSSTTTAANLDFVADFADAAIKVVAAFSGGISFGDHTATLPTDLALWALPTTCALGSGWWVGVGVGGATVAIGVDIAIPGKGQAKTTTKCKDRHSKQCQECKFHSASSHDSIPHCYVRFDRRSQGAVSKASGKERELSLLVFSCLLFNASRVPTWTQYFHFSRSAYGARVSVGSNRRGKEGGFGVFVVDRIKEMPGVGVVSIQWSVWWV